MLSHYTTKNDWTSRNLDYTLEFFTLLYSNTGCIFFSLLPKPIFSYKMSFYQNPIKYCNMAIYCNTHTIQHWPILFHPYCITNISTKLLYFWLIFFWHSTKPFSTQGWITINHSMSNALLDGLMVIIKWYGCVYSLAQW